MSAYARCPSCSRILWPVDGRYPPHRVPPETQPTGTRGVVAAVPLTGDDRPWCEYSRKPVLR